MTKSVAQQCKWRYERQERHYERTVGPSETVPDDALTIQEILLKHTHGQSVDKSRVRDTLYSLKSNENDYDSPDYEAINRMDHTDKFEMSEALRQEIADKKERLSAAIKASEEAKKLEATKELENDSEESLPPTKKSSKKLDKSSDNNNNKSD